MSTGSPRPRRSPPSPWGSTARQPTFQACGTSTERWTHLHREQAVSWAPVPPWPMLRSRWDIQVFMPGRPSAGSCHHPTRLCWCRRTAGYAHGVPGLARQASTSTLSAGTRSCAAFASGSCAVSRIPHPGERFPVGRGGGSGACPFESGSIRRLSGGMARTGRRR